MACLVLFSSPVEGLGRMPRALIEIEIGLDLSCSYVPNMDIIWISYSAVVYVAIPFWKRGSLNTPRFGNNLDVCINGDYFRVSILVSSAKVTGSIFLFAFGMKWSLLLLLCHQSPICTHATNAKSQSRNVCTNPSFPPIETRMRCIGYKALSLSFSSQSQPFSN